MENFTVVELKKIIRQYNLHTIISNYSKLKKASLINEIKKYLHYNGEDFLIKPNDYTINIPKKSSQNPILPYKPEKIKYKKYDEIPKLLESALKEEEIYPVKKAKKIKNENLQKIKVEFDNLIKPKKDKHAMTAKQYADKKKVKSEEEELDDWINSI